MQPSRIISPFSVKEEWGSKLSFLPLHDAECSLCDFRSLIWLYPIPPAIKHPALSSIMGYRLGSLSTFELHLLAPDGTARVEPDIKSNDRRFFYDANGWVNGYRRESTAPNIL